MAFAKKPRPLNRFQLLESDTHADPAETTAREADFSRTSPGSGQRSSNQKTTEYALQRSDQYYLQVYLLLISNQENQCEAAWARIDHGA